MESAISSYLKDIEDSVVAAVVAWRWDVSGSQQPWVVVSASTPRTIVEHHSRNDSG
jgi:hypothetical protein